MSFAATDELGTLPFVRQKPLAAVVALSMPFSSLESSPAGVRRNGAMRPWGHLPLRRLDTTVSLPSLLLELVDILPSPYASYRGLSVSFVLRHSACLVCTWPDRDTLMLSHQATCH